MKCTSYINLDRNMRFCYRVCNLAIVLAKYERGGSFSSKVRRGHLPFLKTSAWAFQVGVYAFSVKRTVIACAAPFLFDILND